MKAAEAWLQAGRLYYLLQEDELVEMYFQVCRRWLELSRAFPSEPFGAGKPGRGSSEHCKPAAGRRNSCLAIRHWISSLSFHPLSLGDFGVKRSDSLSHKVM